MNVCMVVYMYGCMYEWLCVCMYGCMYVWLYVCMVVCMVLCMYGCMYGCMYVYMYVYMYVWLYVCIYVCIYVCMVVCMDVSMYAYISTIRRSNRRSLSFDAAPPKRKHGLMRSNELRMRGLLEECSVQIWLCRSCERYKSDMTERE